jgi:hypothetical protein
MVSTLRPRKIRRRKADVNSFVGWRIGFAILRRVAKASFVYELLISINK